MRLDEMINKRSHPSATGFQGFKFVVQKTREQVEFPSRFRKVLVTEPDSRKFQMYKLERIHEN